MTRRHQLNKAVRERIPGGDALLKALHSCDRMVIDRGTDTHANELLQLLRQSANEMRDYVNKTRNWPEPTYSAATAAEILGMPKRTLNQVTKRHNIGQMIAGKLALTVADLLEIKSKAQGRPGAPDGNNNRRS